MAKNTRKKSHRNSTSRPSSDPPTPTPGPPGPTPPTSSPSIPRTAGPLGPTPPTSGGSMPRTPRPPGPTPSASGGSTPQTSSPSTPRTAGPTPPTSSGSTPQTPRPPGPTPLTSGGSTPQTPRPPRPTSSTSSGSTPQTPSPSTPRTAGPLGPTPPTSGGSTPRNPRPPGPTPQISGGSTPQTQNPSIPQTSRSSTPQAISSSTFASVVASLKSASTSASTSAWGHPSTSASNSASTSGVSTPRTPRPPGPTSSTSGGPNSARNHISTSTPVPPMDRSNEQPLDDFIRYNCQNVYQADDTMSMDIKGTEDDLSIFLEGKSRSITALFPSRPLQVSAPTINKYTPKVYVNHFEIEVPENSKFSLYSMTWRKLYRNAQPEGPGRFDERLKRLWWEEIYEENKVDHMDDIQTVYEGGKKMVAREPFKWSVKMFTHNNGSEVTVTLVTTINIDNYKKFTNQIASNECLFPNDVVKIVNLLVRKYCTNARYRDVKRWYYDLQSEDMQFTDQSMIKKFAYFQSARCLGGGTRGALNLNVDVTSSVFFKGGVKLPVLWDSYVEEHLSSTINGRPVHFFPFQYGIPNSWPWNEEQVEYVHRLWRKMRIKFTHNRGQPKDYTIHKVMTGYAASEVRIPLYPGGTTLCTLNQLLNERYGVTDADIANIEYYMPALKVQKDRESYLTWGCCETTPESRFVGNNDELPSGVKIKLKALDNPQQRHHNIAEWMRNRAQGEAQFDACAGWGVKVSSKMMSVNALLLTKPRLEFRGIGGNVCISSSKGYFNILEFDRTNQTETRLLETPTSCRYILLSMSKNSESFDFTCWDNHLKVLNVKAPLRMVQLTEVVREHHNVDSTIPALQRRDILTRKLDEIINRYRVLIGDRIEYNFDIIICLMSQKLTPEYATVKVRCDREFGVPSQVFIMNSSKSKEKGVDNRVECLLLKINVKCGGQNFKVDRPLFKDTYTMLLGADVTHGSPSIAAVVATTDLNAGKYACRIKSQTPNQERIGHLEDMFKELLYAHCQSTRFWPNDIIFFRDGVSEGEYVNTLRHEGTAILKACTALRQGYRPNLLIVLAIKRHHTRFFKMNQNHRLENIGEGVVVNEGVTHPRVHEFFLCSQYPVLGTSRAVRYHVLLDEIYKKEHAHKLYDLVYMLCHTCQRATKSVALVTPTYYAHLAAYRAKLYMEYWKVTNNMPPAKPPGPRANWLNRALQEDLNAHANLRNNLWFL